MTVKRFSANFRTRNDVFDSITPNNKLQENVSAPHGPWKPAAWLPVEWQDTASKDYFVISSGKIVALDATGRVVPAGYRLKIASSDTFLTYTSTDVDAGVIDIRTGVALITADTGAVTVAVVAEALLDRGIISESALALAYDFDSGLDSHCQAAIEAFISYPVGVLVQDVYVWAGDSPATLTNTNYQMQHMIQFLTDVQMKVPYLASGGNGSDLFNSSTTAWVAGTGTGVEIPDGELAGTRLTLSDASASALARYDGVIESTDSVVGLVLTHSPVAKNTDRTPVACTNATVLVTEKGSPDLVTSEGDWYLDTAVGILFINTTTWDAVKAAGITITFNFYAANGADAARYVHLDGVVRPGDYVTFDVDSNFVASSSSDYRLNVGRLHALISEPRGLLDRVRTSWNLSNMTAADQMPGTATKGFSDNITLNSGDVAGQIAYINVKVQ